MIIFYSTDCPKCHVLEAKLAKKQIKFEVNRNIGEMMKLGLMSAPALSVDGKILLFKEAVEWVNAQGEDGDGTN